MRSTVLGILGHLYARNQEANASLFEYVAERLLRDENVDVRAEAAGVLGFFAYAERLKTPTTLRQALEFERDATARAAIERRIEPIGFTER